MQWIARLRSSACRECLVIVAVCLGLAAALWYSTYERIAHERRETIAAAVRSNDNLALALEEQTIRALKAAEQVLVVMKHEMEQYGRPMTLEMLNEDGFAQNEMFAAAFVIDRDGYVVLPKGKRGVSLGDRAYFAFHRETAGGGVQVGQPAFGRLTQRHVIPVTLRRTRADGAFGGVYAVGIDASYFVSSYKRFDIGSEGVIQLVGLDAVARARRVGSRLSFGDDRSGSGLMREAERATSGHFVTADLEGLAPRFQSYRLVQGYPLIVGVGTSVHETLEDLREREQAYYFAAIAASLLLAAFAAVLVVATRRRIAAMSELHASEQAHRATFDQSAIGVAHSGIDGRMIRVNARFCRMLGYAAGELLGMRFADLTHPDDRQLSLEKAATLTRGPETSLPAYEMRCVRKDGSVVWASVAVSLVRPGSAPDYFIAMVQDISERKRAEARLLEQLDELRRFRKVTVDRELRMMELEAELARLKEHAQA